MPEDLETDYSALSTQELLKRTVRGPESHLGMAKRELITLVKGAAAYAGYNIQQKVNPELATEHKLDYFFSPEIKPGKDREAAYNNPLIYRRHDIFEREGQFITDLRFNGGETIGEVQDLMRLWTAQVGWISKDGGGHLSYFTPMYENLVKTVMLTQEGDKEERRTKTERLLTKFGEEAVYYKFAVFLFRYKPALVEKFYQSEEFARLSTDFKKAHIGAATESDEVIATAMLAGHLLSRFEGVSPGESPSQKFIPNAESYHQRIQTFLENSGGSDVPPLPTGEHTHDINAILAQVESAAFDKYFPDGFKGTEDDKKKFRELEKERDIFHGDISLPDLIPDVDTQNILIIYYNKAVYAKLVDQLKRGKIDRELLKRFDSALKNIPNDKEKASGLLRRVRGHFLEATLKDVIIDPQYRRNILQTAIGNVMLAIALDNGEAVFTASRWMPKSEGYAGKDNPDQIPDIIPATETPTQEEMLMIVKDIFNGQPDADLNNKYRSQTHKIYDYAPQILRFLQNGEGVPDEVREKIEMIMDKNELITKMARRFGPITDQDVNYINRFYREGGLDEAQKVIAYRTVFEFVEGVQTNIINLRKPKSNRLSLNIQNKFRKAGRAVGGCWINEDFSVENDTVINDALKQTLVDGKNQILLYDNKLDPKAKDEVKKLPANKRKRFERYMWDGYDMRFLRWSPRRGSDDNLLQVAIECFCPLRDTVFNPRTIQQW